VHLTSGSTTTAPQSLMAGRTPPLTHDHPTRLLCDDFAKLKPMVHFKPIGQQRHNCCDAKRKAAGLPTVTEKFVAACVAFVMVEKEKKLGDDEEQEHAKETRQEEDWTDSAAGRNGKATSCCVKNMENMEKVETQNQNQHETHNCMGWCG